MTEPTATTAAATLGAPSLIALASGYFGVQLGPFVVIFLGAWCGSFWALVSAPPMSRWQSAGLALRSIMLSVLLTASISHLLSTGFGWHLEELYIVVSIAIAALGDRWLAILDSLKEALMAGMGNVFKPKDTDK